MVASQRGPVAVVPALFSADAYACALRRGPLPRAVARAADDRIPGVMPRGRLVGPSRRVGFRCTLLETVTGFPVLDLLRGLCQYRQSPRLSLFCCYGTIILQ